MIKLYELRRTRSERVRWTMAELGLPFDSVEGREVLGSAELKAISPLGKVPAIRDDGRSLFELAAICAWLADRQPERGLIGASGSWERALHDQWVCFCLTELEAYLWSTARNTFVYPEEMRSPKILEQNRIEGRKALEVLDLHLAAEPFLVGSRLTVADIIVGYAANWAANQGWIDGLDHVSGYVDRLLALPNCTYRRR